MIKSMEQCKARIEELSYMAVHNVDANVQEIWDFLDSLPTQVKVYACECKGWGCRSCCSSDAEIRSRQGVFG